MMAVAMFMIILLTFVIMHAVPGGPFTNDRKVPPEVEAALNEKYHLDLPLHEQFFEYVMKTMLTWCRLFLGRFNLL